MIQLDLLPKRAVVGMERLVACLDEHQSRSRAQSAIDKVVFIKAVQSCPKAIGRFIAFAARSRGARHDADAHAIHAIGFHDRIGANGGGGAVNVTVFVISTVDVTGVVVWLDAPHPARMIASPAIAAALHWIAAG